eukprot:353795-Chlamydomonas_euryale.AAC.1
MEGRKPGRCCTGQRGRTQPGCTVPYRRGCGAALDTEEGINQSVLYCMRVGRREEVWGAKSDRGCAGTRPRPGKGEQAMAVLYWTRRGEGGGRRSGSQSMHRPLPFTHSLDPTPVSTPPQPTRRPLKLFGALQGLTTSVQQRIQGNGVAGIPALEHPIMPTSTCNTNGMRQHRSPVGLLPWLVAWEVQGLTYPAAHPHAHTSSHVHTCRRPSKRRTPRCTWTCLHVTTRAHLHLPRVVMHMSRLALHGAVRCCTVPHGAALLHHAHVPPSAAWCCTVLYGAARCCTVPHGAAPLQHAHVPPSAAWCCTVLYGAARCCTAAPCTCPA